MKSIGSPGRGREAPFDFWGRQGRNKGSLRIVDFRAQRGIYILYGNYGLLCGPH
jgi:hypothetical protein